MFSLCLELKRFPLGINKVPTWPSTIGGCLCPWCVCLSIPDFHTSCFHQWPLLREHSLGHLGESLSWLAMNIEMVKCDSVSWGRYSCYNSMCHEPLSKDVQSVKPHFGVSFSICSVKSFSWPLSAGTAVGIGHRVQTINWSKLKSQHSSRSKGHIQPW